MADQNSKSWSIRIKLGTRKLLRSLVTNLTPNSENSKCRIQYGWPKCENFVVSDETRYTGAFGVTGYESNLKIEKSKMADPIWPIKIHKVGRSG